MTRAARLLAVAADKVAALMLAAIFAIFLWQIAARYVFNASVGWTIEANLTLWLWLVLFSCAFVLRESDHVKFDLLVQSSPRPVRRAFAVIAALVIAGALILAWAPTLDYVSFYKIKKSATLRVPLNYVFSIYMVFCSVLILRYLWRAGVVLRGGDLAVDGDDLPGVGR